MKALDNLGLDIPQTVISCFNDLLWMCSKLRLLHTSVKNFSRNKVLKVSCKGGTADFPERRENENQGFGETENQMTFVMKFGGSSVASATRMKKVADIILSFPNEKPVIVLSAMEKTTNKLLLAGEKAVSSSVTNILSIEELNFVKTLHLKTMEELGIDRTFIITHLEELEQLLKGIAMFKELTFRARDYLVSFGECMSTRIFATYLNKIGVKARQYDAFDIGFITTDDFTNADILEATYPAVAKRLIGDWANDPTIPIITSFLGKGLTSCAITTLGRGGSDLTATVIGKALGVREIQVWKDVDGILTCDPNIYPGAQVVPYLTFDEAAKLAYSGAQVVLTSIVSKRNINMLDIVNPRMLGQYGFLAKVSSTFEDLGISVDVVATSDVSISSTLDPSKLWSRELIQQAFCALRRNEVHVQMISTAINKGNFSLAVNDNEVQQCVKAIHTAFFGHPF